MVCLMNRQPSGSRQTDGPGATASVADYQDVHVSWQSWCVFHRQFENGKVCVLKAVHKLFPLTSTPNKELQMPSTSFPALMSYLWWKKHFAQVSLVCFSAVCTGQLHGNRCQNSNVLSEVRASERERKSDFINGRPGAGLDAVQVTVHCGPPWERMRREMTVTSLQTEQLTKRTTWYFILKGG